MTEEAWTAAKLPKADEEFVFKTVDSAPAWIDKGWAGYSGGPALQLPVDPSGEGHPYTTITARVGDKVVYTAAKGARPATFTVIPGDVTPEEGGTEKIPQVTNASLEDLLRSENMTVDDLGEDAKAQVAVRSPRIAENVGITEPATNPPPTPVSGS